MESILKISNVSKKFNDNQVLNGISFDVKPNTVVGFVGNNGAGKTTTMKIILGLLKQDSGEIQVCGDTVTYGDTKTNRYIGYLPDVPSFYSYMSPREYLTFCADITNVPKERKKQKVDELLEFVGLSGKADKKIKGFSRGMKQRLGIAQALINEPKILICDEPTSALDPIGRAEILDILDNIRDKTTVIFSTHILSDIERICDNVVMLNQGKIVLDGSIEELKSNYRYDDIRIVFRTSEDRELFWEELKLEKEIEWTSNMDREVQLHILGDMKAAEEKLGKFFYEKKIVPQLFEIMEPSLEKMFMSMYSK